MPHLPGRPLSLASYLTAAGSASAVRPAAFDAGALWPCGLAL